ncbi:hypothetical protein BJV82DRAFT_263293 [Fennellomyces sp. T-0311]|nr:hypothetical protein BJV82DRAFT_263293 [Fennellomyces sp. T-0311]
MVKSGYSVVKKLMINHFEKLFTKIRQKLFAVIYDTDGGTHPPGINSDLLETSKKVPHFKPTSLVRVSDMQVVPGSTVNEHYWTLSYSWNQSGKIIRVGAEEYDRIDEGKHTIVSYKIQQSIGQEDGQGKQRIVYEIDPESKSVRRGKFEDTLQQVCKDFAIRYIFFDQKCINQKDVDEEKRDIKRILLFYQNAYCTLVLLPELECNETPDDGRILANINDALADSRWSSPAWTLLEAYVSKKLLFVGKNVRFWSNTIYEGLSRSRTVEYMRNICYSKTWKPSTAIWSKSALTTASLCLTWKSSFLAFWSAVMPQCYFLGYLLILILVTTGIPQSWKKSNYCHHGVGLPVPIFQRIQSSATQLKRQS